MDVLAGTPGIVTIQPGFQMTVTAGAASGGVIRRIGPNSQLIGNRITNIAANQTKKFGPFNNPRQYSIETTGVVLSYSIDKPDIPLLNALKNIQGFTGSFTLKDSDNGMTFRCDDTADVVVIVPGNLEMGFNCDFVCGSNAAVALSFQNGATLRVGGSLLFGQYSRGHLEVINNIGGSAADISVSGDFFTQVKPLNDIAHFGDSRRAQTVTDAGFNKRKSMYDWFNWANARANNRLRNVAFLGTSGDRGDQMYARLASLLAAKAGTMVLQFGVNDGQQAIAGYTRVNTFGPNQGVAVTQSTVAGIVLADYEYFIKAFLGAGGQKIMLCIEQGSEAWNSAALGVLANIAHGQRQLAIKYSGNVVPIDIPRYLVDPSTSTASARRFYANSMQEASGSGVHTGHKGAYLIGAGVAPQVIANWPDAISMLPVSNDEVLANDKVNLLSNPLAMIATGGTVNTGLTGTGAGSYAYSRVSGGSGTQTGTVSIGAATQGGLGNEHILTLTSVAAGDAIRVSQDTLVTNLTVGDVIQSVCRVVVDAGGVAVAATVLELQYNDGTTTQITSDMSLLNNQALPTDGYTIELKTDALTVTPNSGSPFCTQRMSVYGSAAGAQPAMRVQQFQMHKVPQL